jgi:hypothetical protein
MSVAFGKLQEENVLMKPRIRRLFLSDQEGTPIVVERVLKLLNAKVEIAQPGSIVIDRIG